MADQPRSRLSAKKNQRDRLIRFAQTHPAWMLGFADEVWWSRLAQPQLHRWVPAGDELRLVQKTRPADDAEPKAWACYGLFVRAPATPERLWLRFATGPPVSEITIQFLAWCGDQVAALGKQALLLVWDNASGPRSQTVQHGLHRHHQLVKQAQHGVRLIVCRLPSRSPWLKPSEPKGSQGKRAVLEPERVLTASELESRVYAYSGCPPAPRLMITQQAA